MNNMKPLTISAALAWPDPPEGALSWIEPHIVCQADGIWIVWYRTDGKHWKPLKREEIAINADV